MFICLTLQEKNRVFNFFLMRSVYQNYNIGHTLKYLAMNYIILKL